MQKRIVPRVEYIFENAHSRINNGASNELPPVSKFNDGASDATFQLASEQYRTCIYCSQRASTVRNVHLLCATMNEPIVNARIRSADQEEGAGKLSLNRDFDQFPKFYRRGIFKICSIIKIDKSFCFEALYFEKISKVCIDLTSYKPVRRLPSLLVT